MTDIIGLLPDSLNLPPHLSAHKYFFVCTLTVAAWDTLVLSPRAWRLMRTKEWPTLKVIFHFLRFFMPAEFIIVAVAFFDTDWSQARCQKFFLFEPIATAVLLAACSIVHVIRVHAIYDKSRVVLAGLGALFAVQVVTMGISSGFYRSVPLKLGQGCIAGPKENWVGIYWLAPTLLYTASFALALARSMKSLQTKPLSLWKLMLRDGLNLYGAIWVVNMVNMLFWFIITPTGPSDTIKTIVTSMAAVLTTTMTLRIILSVRGSLVSGGSFAGSSSAGAHSSSRSHGTTHVISTRATNNGANNNPNLSISPQIVSRPNQTYTLEDMRAKSEREWVENDGKSSVHEAKEGIIPNEDYVPPGPLGVKITVDREVDFADRH
ncbi:hypothetical protein BD410DRAFT_827866 [Rickenella mellea]|uniref:Uncharacterized protein n=1 Tax=Rickenella mellea TaxID=50990 RepID=A0A4Y7Q7P8_9AGAM|nr:hypothetical protein BD410DRAFT_827866 [Rickenella mellea]